MAIEEVSQISSKGWTDGANDTQEFSIEIPDKDADNIHSGAYIHTYDYNLQLLTLRNSGKRCHLHPEPARWYCPFFISSFRTAC